jgi:hypothetical protein
MKPIPTTATKRRAFGALVAAIGFILSPLSWWNDLVVNVPLALAFAWLVSWWHRPAFAAAFVIGYWLTNVLGLVMMHRGAELTVGSKWRPYSRSQLARDLLIAVGYTALILALVKLKVLGPLPNYLHY